jgi:hypothetical protein
VKQEVFLAQCWLTSIPQVHKGVLGRGMGWLGGGKYLVDTIIAAERRTQGGAPSCVSSWTSRSRGKHITS